jgi:NAD(P)-dependent dehydrogenase (short-subunit alcohol dehydrogenase family)
MASYNLPGRVALVTGGARGIGFATARALIDRGASVALADLDADVVAGAAARLHDQRAIGLAADVTDRSAMQRAVARTVERFGSLDVLVANAGIAPAISTFRTMPTETFERVLDVNLMGVYRTVDAALPEIIRRRGHIVVISSVYAFLNGVGEAPYAMSKAAVEQFGRALRVELAQHGAGVSIAYFGFVDTEMVRGALDADPLARRMLSTFPRPLQKRLSPTVAGEAIVDGIQERRARIIRPRRWTAMSALRGIIEPLTDVRLGRDRLTQELLSELDSRAAERGSAPDA